MFILVLTICLVSTPVCIEYDTSGARWVSHEACMIEAPRLVNFVLERDFPMVLARSFWYCDRAPIERS